MKSCKQCGESKPVSEFYKNASNKDGREGKCRQCRGAKGRYRHAQITKIEVDGELIDAKNCVLCCEVKPLNEFSELQGKKYGVGDRRPRCKACERELKKAYYIENRDFIQNRNRAWYELNKDVDYAKYKEWAALNRESIQAKDARRIARKHGLRCDMSGDDWVSVLTKFDSKCALTGSSENVTLDHFIPVSTGHGGTYKGNVYPITASLNSSKNAINPFEWVKNRDNIDEVKWLELVGYLSSQNGMSPEEFEGYVYSCFR